MEVDLSLNPKRPRYGSSPQASAPATKEVELEQLELKGFPNNIAHAASPCLISSFPFDWIDCGQEQRRPPLSHLQNPVNISRLSPRRQQYLTKCLTSSNLLGIGIYRVTEHLGRSDRDWTPSKLPNFQTAKLNMAERLGAA